MKRAMLRGWVLALGAAGGCLALAGAARPPRRRRS